MANILKGLTHDDPKQKHPKPYGPEEKVYLGRYMRGVLMDPKSTPIVPVTINGYTKWVPMGKETLMNKEYADVLEQSQSEVQTTDVEQYDPERGGHPRPQRDFGNPQLRTESLGDFEVVRRSKEG